MESSVKCCSPTPSLCSKYVCIRLFLFVLKTSSFIGSHTVSSLFTSTMEFRPVSLVPTSSTVNSANSWNPIEEDNDFVKLDFGYGDAVVEEERRRRGFLAVGYAGVESELSIIDLDCDSVHGETVGIRESTVSGAIE